METPEYVKKFWQMYGDASNFVEVTCGDNARGGSLANHVLETFNIPVEGGSSSIGGNLENLDIKRMDAMAVISLSLLEEAKSGSGSIYEPITNEEGEVKFAKVGGGTADLSDIYHEIQSSEYIENCVGVLVKGGKRLPYWQSLEWKPIWGEGGNSSKKVFDTTDIDTGCLVDNFSTHATITFNDPHLDTSYNDGIDNLFEMTDPFDKFLGYARFCHVPDEYKTNSTKVKVENSAVVPIRLDDTYMGKLVNIPSIVGPLNIGTDWVSGCWSVTEGVVPKDGGVLIPIPDSLRYEDIRGTKVDKFVKVEGVYLKGVELSSMQAGIKDETNPGSKEAIVVINIDKAFGVMFELSEGEHYIVKYEEGSDGYIEPYLIFSKNSRVNEVVPYGQNTEYIIGAHSNISTYDMGTTGTATIFPLDVNKGVLVEEIIIKIRLESPSITVFDPHQLGSEGEKSTARNIADKLEYVLCPLIVHEEPPSMAFDGTVLDQESQAKDNDPTTVQDFSETDYEKALDKMAGGPELEITLPFINKDKASDDRAVENISNTLKSHMDHRDGINTTYVCGPTTKVELCEHAPAGGIVNEITYSYNDSGSYTISVNEGPRLVGNFSGGGPSGPSFKSTETFSTRATIVDSIGNGIFHKVRIDGYGERVAINMADSIIRVGDVVNCTVHNNAVEA